MSRVWAVESDAKTKTKIKAKLNRELEVGYIYWQETIGLKSQGNSATMRTQSQGLMAQVNWQHFLNKKSRWYPIYGGEIAMGSIKGKGNTAAIADELKGQSWILAGGHAGMIYRSTAVSNFGLTVPINYRLINWKLQSDSSLDPDRDNSFSFGLRGIFEVRISPRSWGQFQLTQQHSWTATQFAMNWKWLF